MHPEDAFDAVHLAAAGQVAAFAEALDSPGKVPPAEAHRHADNAYLFVEFLANTYPKPPRDATERDAWVFLFDYYLTQGPFAGPAVRLAPRSVGLFVDFLARRERVRELDPLRAACAMEDYYLKRLEWFEAIGRKAQGPRADPREIERDLADWWQDLDSRMRPRGLMPDASLAGGEETWGHEMGPVEAAVFDAVTMVLSRRARELSARGASQDEVERELLAAQRRFMTEPNRGLGRSPLEAVLGERAQLGSD